MWEELKEKIEQLPEFSVLEKKLFGGEAEAIVTGLAGSSRSLVLSLLAGRRGGQILVIAADPVRARDIEADLASFGAVDVVLYPEDEILPYDYHDPDRNLTGLQMRALDVLTQGRCSILICTARSLMKKIFPPPLFRRLIITLGTGDEIDMTELSSKLVRLGYERHEIVESKGQFAVRGGIVDIFEVCALNPVRMEFDGDEVFSIREFDIESQRSTSAIEGIRIRPFHHIAPEEAGLERLREFLRKKAEGAEEERREKILLPAERIEKGILFFGMEHYAPLVHDVVPIFDYFETTPAVALFDAEDVASSMEAFREEVEQRHRRALEEEQVYPEPDRVYMAEAELEAVMKKARKVVFPGLASGGAVKFSAGATGDYRRNLKGLVRDIKKEKDEGLQVFLFCSSVVQRNRTEEVLSEVSIDIDFPLGYISSGFRWPEVGVLVLSEDEVFGRFHRPWHSPRAASRSLTYDPSHFKPGDFIVHVDHGIGRYMGMRVLEVEGSSTECLDIRYEGYDRLFIPVSRLRLVEKYTAADGTVPQLASLGSRAWNRARERARKSAGKIAQELLEIYAARQVASGHTFGPDKPWQKELEASFQWEETDHQLQATDEVKSDMEKPSPMDRLLCGDVGFGKTEVAVRAAFKAVLSGKQVAVLVPTTVLALQHHTTLSDRLSGFPVRVEMLSRFVKPARQQKVVTDLAEGKVDIIIGTHRILSKDIAFRDLGLVIIDEEHRFGVKHKEKFKIMKKSVDVLSMTATPIPRTLSMALSGIRDISVIDTPPRNRLPIHTEILSFDDAMIREAVMREVNRGGQVFFVHNRVQSIGVMEGYLRRLLPDRVRIAHAHGQMNERELERIMIEFLERRFDVLLSTMIIEAGLDFPNVNTIIINRSDKFGLAQLYQLRGRVGRSDRKAYAYMLIPKGRTLTAAAIRRLQAISEFDYLGAGYRIAMRDLEIRGAGNLLGHQQSGQINAVGLDLYSRMIKEEVGRIRGDQPSEEKDSTVSLPVPAYIPEEYISDSEERMDIYRRLTRVKAAGEVMTIREELEDRFGKVPAPADNMLKVLEFRVRGIKAGLESIETRIDGRVTAAFAPDRLPAREVMAEIAARFEGRLTFHTGTGLSLTLEPLRGGGPAPAPTEGGAGWRALRGSGDIESLLNLLEFCVK